ncbi:putative Cation-transporting ATPase pma1 [Blattamonas nauphoetae]|uniref:Cation-transporting ATPase pma1 n=1 Tax=Blattamonas nauphoetae TaxID=2049346 RepID=A0ABQ9WUM7_9EUKA|nr:putative Cation-transporting ATPase pma1 [Blattamonas nauphoetae]
MMKAMKLLLMFVTLNRIVSTGETKQLNKFAVPKSLRFSNLSGWASFTMSDNSLDDLLSFSLLKFRFHEIVGKTTHLTQITIVKLSVGYFLRIEAQIPAILVFLVQFHEVLIYLLIAVMIVCFVMQQWTEGIVIFIVVIINTIIGFVQEYKADKASETLDQLFSLESKVIRSSVHTKIGTNELVPGDIVIIQSGDKVPADCRVFDFNQLHTEEAALTGETTANPKFVCIHGVDTVAEIAQTCSSQARTSQRELGQPSV